MTLLAFPVPQETRSALGEAMHQARLRCEMKLETIGALMGGLRAEAVYQMEQGQRSVNVERLALMATDADGRRFLALFVQQFAEMVGVEDLDAIASQLRIVNGLFARRMAKAALGNVEQERKRA